MQFIERNCWLWHIDRFQRIVLLFGTFEILYDARSVYEKGIAIELVGRYEPYENGRFD